MDFRLKSKYYVVAGFFFFFRAAVCESWTIDSDESVYRQKSIEVHSSTPREELSQIAHRLHMDNMGGVECGSGTLEPVMPASYYGLIFYWRSVSREGYSPHQHRLLVQLLR